MARGFVDILGNIHPIFVMRNGQEVAYTGTAGVITNVMGPDCKLIAFWATSDAYVRIVPGAADASNVDIHAPAGVLLFHPVTAALTKVAAKQITAGGTLHVMEAY